MCQYSDPVTATRFIPRFKIIPEIDRSNFFKEKWNKVYCCVMRYNREMRVVPSAFFSVA